MRLVRLPVALVLPRLALPSRCPVTRPGNLPRTEVRTDRGCRLDRRERSGQDEHTLIFPIVAARVPIDRDSFESVEPRSDDRRRAGRDGGAHRAATATRHARARGLLRAGVLACIVAATAGWAHAQPDPLPSWQDGPAKARIVAFVQAVSAPGGPDFVPPADRIAVFDNDGTLWSEQPAYFQLAFAIDRVRALAPQHPEWKDRQPFKAALAGDMKALAASGERGLLELMMATHAGMTTDEFARIVRDWAKSARHPTLGRPYTELTYRPMRELLDYLRANGFATWIVSGGGVEFLRVLATELYGVPPEQVVGSSVKTRYEVRNGTPVIVRLPEIDFIDDKAGKPVAIHKYIGRRPVAAFGNSDGDFQVLEWTTSAPGARLGVIVRHDDGAREYAYDRGSPIGRLARGLDEAGQRGWVVVSMKDDWREMYAPPR